jgi:GT2 family glycosyltransferase
VTGAYDVSVVVPNYMGAGLLPGTLDCLQSALHGEAQRVEVIVSDDASADGSAAAVERGRPDVRVLRAERNEGFGAACNRGALAASAPLLFFLNSDAHVRPGFLGPLVEHFRDPQVFSVMPLMLGSRGQLQQPAQSSFDVRRGMLRVVHPSGIDGAHGLDALRRIGAVPTLYASGSALLVRKDRFLALGGFAEMLAPFYYEDIDLGWRAWRRGWRTLFEPRSTVEHLGGATIGATCDPRVVSILRKRNRTLMLWRNLLDGGALLRLHALPMPLHQLGRLAYGDTSSLAGLRAAWRLRDAVRAHRRLERSAVRMTDAEIQALLDRTRLDLQARLGAANGHGHASPNGAPHRELESHAAPP